MDKESDEGKSGSVFKTIQAAIDAAEPGSVIKIGSNLYDESLHIT